MKRNSYYNVFCNRYFWRTIQQKEIDYVEEQDGAISGFEFKWKPKSKTTIPSTFTETYSAKVSIISKDNFRDFILKPGPELNASER